MFSKAYLKIFIMVLLVTVMAAPAMSDIVEWNGATWQLGPQAFIDSNNHLIGHGSGTAESHSFSSLDLIGREILFEAWFLTPEVNTNAMLFVDGLDSNGNASRFHLGVMGSTGAYHGAKYITSGSSTPSDPTHFYMDRELSDIGMEHHVAIHKLPDGQSVQFIYDGNNFATIYAPDGVGDMLSSITAISLGSFMPADRNLRMTFTDFSSTQESSVVPEPASVLLFGSALAGFAAYRRRKRRTEKP